MAHGQLSAALAPSFSCCFYSGAAQRSPSVGTTQRSGPSAGDKGWSFGVAGWEDDKPIQPGDILVFKYKPGAHNVVEVDVAGYMECKAPDGAQVYSTGNDSFEEPGGKAYYICTFPGHCERGMRIGIPPR